MYIDLLPDPWVSIGAFWFRSDIYIRQHGNSKRVLRSVQAGSSGSVEVFKFAPVSSWQ